MHRRPRAAPLARHSRCSDRVPLTTPRDLLHTFELSIVLESHAVTRAATFAERDLCAAEASLADFDHAMQTRRLARWAGLEIQFHRALDDQCGNQVLAAMAERTLREGLSACPILSPDVLRALQSHHLEILRCVQNGAPETATRHTRAHLLYLRNVLVDALGTSTSACTPRMRSRLRT